MPPKQQKKKKVDNRRTPTGLKEYQVKELVKTRVLNSRKQYLVRWEDYEDSEFDTWLYEEDITQSAINGYAEGKSFTNMRASILACRHPSDPAYGDHVRMTMWLTGTMSTKQKHGKKRDGKKMDETGDDGREGTGGGDHGEGGGDGSDGRGDERGSSKKKAKPSEAKSTPATSR